MTSGRARWSRPGPTGFSPCPRRSSGPHGRGGAGPAKGPQDAATSPEPRTPTRPCPAPNRSGTEPPGRHRCVSALPLREADAAVLRLNTPSPSPATKARPRSLTIPLTCKENPRSTRSRPLKKDKMGIGRRMHGNSGRGELK